MKKLFIFVSLLTLGTSAVLRAQTGGELNRQMEVTRAYEPTVREASKLDIKPNMVDTVKLRPEFDYLIQPQPISYGFQVTPFRAATINVNDYRLYTPFYVKAALGVPFQSLLDFYYNTTGMEKGFVSAYLNHYGSWSKIENDNGVKAPATSTYNKVGALGERRFGRYSLNGGIGYDYDLVSRYGYYTDGEPLAETFDTTADGLRQYFSTLHARVAFGDTFEDLSHFNFRIAARGAYFNDRYDYTQTDFGASLELGKCFADRHEVTFGVRYDAYRGNNDYQNDLVTVSPLYHLKTGKFDFALGVDYTFNRMTDPAGLDRTRQKNYFFPRFQMRIDATSGYFVPYVEIDGRVRSNDYRSLSMENSYVMSQLAPNTIEYNGRVGFTGSFSSSFSYKVYGGVSLLKDFLTPANYYLLAGEPTAPDQQPMADTYGETFRMLADSLNLWTLGVDLEGRISGSFGLEASVQYQGFSSSSYEHVSGEPNLMARLNLRYSYRDKLILNLGGTFQSSRYFASMIDEVGEYIPVLEGPQQERAGGHHHARYRASHGIPAW